MATHSVDRPEEAFLTQSDGVAVSFWIISIAMIASTVFFFAESHCVDGHWKTSLHVGMLVTLVAGVHYMYMREYWVQMHESPIIYRYIDWSITVPLQMVEFNLIAKAADPNNKVNPAGFWVLLLGTIFMLSFGYMGETGVMDPVTGFAVGMFGWFVILCEIFFGFSSIGRVTNASQHVKTAFNTMRVIVTLGWSIYPLGYYMGVLVHGVDQTALNVLYNIADFVNKIWFVLACWSCAKSDTADHEAATLKNAPLLA